MKHNKQNLDAIIDHAAREIRDEQLDESVINQSATRVWARISQQMADENSLSATAHLGDLTTMNTNATSEQINGCADFQSLIPAYLDGKLSTARTLLFKDHTNECIPCRRALKFQSADQTTKTAAIGVRQPARGQQRAYMNGWSRTNVARWSVAAVFVICVGLAGLFVSERFDWSGRTLAATIENASGAIYVVSDAQSRQLAAGEQLQKGERVRTAKDSNAVLRLADGSTVEMRERSEFSVTENRRGVTVQLERGDVIVEAAKQHNGRLYVQTPDSLVSVKGTIFAVESGTKGSRVSVVEGEVQVNHAGKDETLLPGDQTTTSPSLDRTPVQQNVAWSRNAARYANLVSELAKLQRDVNQRVQLPGVRYSSKFVDVVPENTVFYAALPNLTDTLAESQRIMQERISQNPALAEWWKGNKGDGLGINEQTLARVREFGSQLGEEIVVSAEMDAKGEPNGILVFGEVKNAANFRTYLDGQLARFAKDLGDAPNVRIIDDPMTATVASPSTPTTVNGSVKSKEAPAKNAATKSEVFVWIHNDIFAASPQLERLRGLATTLNAPDANRFKGSAFHQRINDVYRDGAGLVVAADLEKIIAQSVSKNTKPEEARHIEGFKQLGVMNLRHFVVEQKEVGGKTLSRAALTFSERNRGIASWLADPGSMGALDFISANANVATAFVVKKPELLVDDLLGFFETVEPDLRRQMQEIEKSQGIDLRNDFAAALGGEFAFAIDGPIFPTPSWKVILEVYDQAKLQGTFERAIEKLNQFSVLHGKGKLILESATSGDRTFYSLKSDKGGLGVYYTYANGYLIAAPSRALLEQSIANRDAGNTLVSSSRFKSALSQDGNTNFSAIFYHDLAPLMKPLAERMKNAGGAELTEEQRQTLGSIDANAPPTLVYVYAQGDRITLAANTEGGAFGLSPASLIGLPHSFEMQHILMNAMGDKNVQKK
ncbi:MAG: FecR domain-containing protein [Acidobacteria bacterium]|nr:FecR domain-containing protein [Acidobacteriota bacterium]MCA1639301.1 FecR domain-containing protein [Acidobacteriota bacterium]